MPLPVLMPRPLAPRRALRWRPSAAAAALTLALAGCARSPQTEAGPAAPAGLDWAGAPAVEVALDEYAFHPERLALRQGQPVVLRLVNRGDRAHDFTAPAFFASAATRPGDPVAAALRAAGGSVDVPAGQVREVALVPLAAGSYPVDCEKPLHGLFGMTGEVVVAPPPPA
jgi:uncharacterized cupredoxin-like copper-binding protein